jgi:ribulose-5-phosphate 4-epimerase/fuculose-1-phosphate aldolase
MKKGDTIQDLVKFSRMLYERGLVHAEGGNCSIRSGDETASGSDVWITRTGSVLGRLSEEDLTRITLEGEVLAGDKPSKEWPMHLAFYKARPDARAIIHIHPTYAIAFSTLLAEPMLDAIPAYTSAFYRRAGRVPMIDYYPVGSRDLHEAIGALAPHFFAILMKQHGVTVISSSLSKAFGIIEEIEQCCHIALLTHGEGMPLSDRERAAIDVLQGRSWPEKIA